MISLRSATHFEVLKSKLKTNETNQQKTMKKKLSLFALFFFFFSLLLCCPSSSAFESDELLADDEEFGLEGGSKPQIKPREPAPTRSTTTTTRRKVPDQDSDSKIQFSLEHAFGDSDFVPAGTFSARLKTSSQGGQTLTKLRFSRNAFTGEDKGKFEKLLQYDDFYRIRLPSNAVSPPGRDYIISSVKARCLPREGLDEHFVIHMEGVNILAVNYGAFGACSYPRQLKLPGKWSFNSHTVLKNSEQAPRAPIFAEEVLGENGEGKIVPPPERSFWAKYWMYLIPLGLIVINAVTQAMNMPEEGVQGGGPTQQSAAAIQRGPGSAVRRR